MHTQISFHVKKVKSELSQGLVTLRCLYTLKPLFC